MIQYTCLLCKDTGRVFHWSSIFNVPCWRCKERREQEEKIFAEKIAAIHPPAPGRTLFQITNEIVGVPSEVKMPAFYPKPRIRKLPSTDQWICQYRHSWAFAINPAAAYSEWKKDYDRYYRGAKR